MEKFFEKSENGVFEGYGSIAQEHVIGMGASDTVTAKREECFQTIAKPFALIVVECLKERFPECELVSAFNIFSSL